MSEKEGYAEDAKRDLMPKEYIVPVKYYLHFFDRVEPPNESEILLNLELRNSIRYGFILQSFDIGKAELA